MVKTMDKRLILLVLISCSLIIFFAYRLIFEFVKRKITKDSNRFRYLEWLQQKLGAEIIEPRYVYSVPMKSKAQLDKINVENQMQILISNGTPPLDLVQKGIVNQEKTKEYEDLLRAAPSYSESASLIFRFLEKKLTNRLEIQTKPIIPIFVFSFCYSSPQGRNHYHRDYSFTPERILEYAKRAKEAKAYKQSAQYERSLMTDSLRYDIMKRDGFKCVLCGAKASDGVRLHVDHIQPVSKGGKTERSNLRTLCERCNMGKRDKYDRFGIN